MQAPAISPYAPSAHRIQREGIGYASALTVDQLRKAVPSAFADTPHSSRSERYAYIPTSDIIEGMRKEGFLPVNAVQSRARDADKAGHTKHMIRFRREDQLAASEAREVGLVNSHDGSSAFHLYAGIFRRICSNGLVVGNEDIHEKIRHSGNATGEVIDCAFRIVEQFDTVSAEIEDMKATQLTPELSNAFALAALDARFDTPEKPLTVDQVLRAKRDEDRGNDVWRTFNRAQEALLRGGILGTTRDARGRQQRRTTREVKGIDQNTALNRALWRLATEMAKLAK